jgi:hypothetical protein
LSAVSEGEAYRIASRYFRALDKMSEDWWEIEAPKLDQEQLKEALDNLRIDEVVMTGGSKHYEEEDGSFFLNSFLREHQIVCAPGSRIYQKLRELFRRARLEDTRQTIDRIENQSVNAQRSSRCSAGQTDTSRSKHMKSISNRLSSGCSWDRADYNVVFKNDRA